MGVGKAGQGQMTAGVDETRAGRGQRPDFRIIAKGNDAAFLNGDGFGPGAIGPLRVDAGVVEDEINHWPVSGMNLADIPLIVSIRCLKSKRGDRNGRLSQMKGDGCQFVPATSVKSNSPTRWT